MQPASHTAPTRTRYWVIVFAITSGDQYFCMSYGWYFYITWLPTYLREARQLDVAKSALLAGMPLFFGGIGCPLAG